MATMSAKTTIVNQSPQAAGTWATLISTVPIAKT